jgi:hypothetical protein
MPRKFSPSDFCGSCLEIGCASDGSGTVRETLNSPGYSTPLGRFDINYMILLGLKNNGGCSSCINMVERATEENDDDDDDDYGDEDVYDDDDDED